eukprot:CAMPEP_0184686728 /NCGR_PEP_ID=MMETSP0312-20130426/23776_1 /TAXON_ID=31354 /ORGANISM="Compsopogon coeruleus, Strain SAG 36.94" /LENGTH=288 /DNA_ID=CAMNT_0027142151 /DNA_START=175 /DNA_END=1041 /DNA_ORIENTATION=-
MVDGSGGGLPTINGAGIYRLSLGERARTIVHICRKGTLCTESEKHNGHPFGSHVDYILDDGGRPVFMLASNAAHSKNLRASARCSLFCQPPSLSGQEGGRVTLVGQIEKVPDDERVDIQEEYIDYHAAAAEALSSFPEKFSFYRMRVEDIFFVGGFGVTATWVSPDDFALAEPDPLAFDAPSIVAATNERRQDDLIRLTRVFLGLEGTPKVQMMSLDRLGFDMRVKTESGEVREYRIGFREKVGNRFDVQSALTKTLQEAWERENGFGESWDEADERPVIMYYGGQRT